ncbi:cyclase family protein [uncultured Methanofollis sp.]|uniref:cyclase family protein n=1 Tax=uncultured Methanofollis sp. TaxID=262500 RepID=UPI002639F3E4|nr:cyclase family protein [uncultured Methanofollis sp.]
MSVFHDVTRPLSGETVIYPGDPAVTFRREEHGDYRIAALALGTHSGTHIDAPSHYLKDGATVDAIPPERLIGRCRVVDLGERTVITRGDLEGRTGCADKVLLKTGFSGRTAFDPAYPHLTADAAAFLAEAGVVCIGIDSPSIEAFDGDGTVHRTLLQEGIAIIELLDLSGVPGGDYYMIALPLRLKGLDGAPARVVLSDTPIS